MTNLRELIKWLKMISGKSVLHVPQGIGAFYCKDKLCGYYNDLRKKVYFTKNLDDKGIPLNILTNGKKIYFPTTIAQYGLGAYDIYLETKNDKYLKKAISCAEWLLENQDQKGGWDILASLNLKNDISIYSAMTQGEVASLLFRVGHETVYTHRTKYFNKAEKALELMLLPLSLGGTARIVSNKYLYLEEYPSKLPNTILNGWIYAIFGLYDGVLITKRRDFQNSLNCTLNTLISTLIRYDTGFWSYYDLNRHLASPFYHNTHIALLKVCADLFNNSHLLNFSLRWEKYQKRIVNRSLAFNIKAFQKLIAPSNTTIVE